MQHKITFLRAKCQNWMVKHKITFWIVIPMLIFGVACFIFAIVFKSQIILSNVLSDLVSGSLIVIITITFVEWLPRHNQDVKWKPVRSVAKEDLLQFRNQLISYMVSPFGYKIDIQSAEFDVNNINESSRKILNGFVDKILAENINDLLSKLENDKWRQLELNMKLIRSEFLEYFQLYQEIMPPEVLGKFLIVHKNFKKTFNTFGLILTGGLFDATLKQNLKEAYIKSFAEDLTNYFKSLKDFIKETDK